MNKTALLAQILHRLEADRATCEAALAAAHDAATHAESKAENKYDTRGLEAAYLADGQRRRLHEIELAMAAYRHLELPAAGGEIRVGALVTLELDGCAQRVFLGPDAAGLKLAFEGAPLLVISPRSPLGARLLGCLADDDIELVVEGRVRTYSVLAVD